MKHTKLWLIAVLVLGLVLAACGAEADGYDLDGTSWVLVTYRKNAPLPDTNPTLIFEGDQVSGNASCNSFGGGYTINGQEISFEQMFTTMMACMQPDGIMEQEADYMEMLSQVREYEVQDGQLVLHFDAHETLVFDQIEQ
jgi:heat shock protein HslJ